MMAEQINDKYNQTTNYLCMGYIINAITILIVNYCFNIILKIKHQYQDMIMALVDHNLPGQQYPTVLVHKVVMNLET